MRLLLLWCSVVMTGLFLGSPLTGASDALTGKASAAAYSQKSGESMVEETVQMEETAQTDGELVFDVYFDKGALESRRKPAVTFRLATNAAKWEYTVYAEHGAVYNLSPDAFTYASPREEVLNDTIQIWFTDLDNRKMRIVTIPLSFTQNPEEIAAYEIMFL